MRTLIFVLAGWHHDKKVTRHLGPATRFKPLKDDWCGTSKLQSYFCGTSKLLSHHVYPGSIGMLGRMVCILTT